MTVSEYVIRFTQLSLYAPNDVNIDEKKQECFLNWLNDGLANALEARNFENFQAMVNKALILENHRAILECEHKQEGQVRVNKATNPDPDLTLHLPGLFSTLCSRVFSRCLNQLDNNSLTLKTRLSHWPTTFKLATLEFKMCRGFTPLRMQERLQLRENSTIMERGHIVVTCPNLRSHPPPTSTSNSTPPPNRNENVDPVKAKQNYAQGWVNQFAMKKAQDTLMNGTFLVNLDHVQTIYWSLFFSALRTSGRDSF
jgi:hypothetical protein